jgi:hypothetical protein
MGTGSNPPGSEEPVLNIAGERVALGPLRAELSPLYGRWINDFLHAKFAEHPDEVRRTPLPCTPVTQFLLGDLMYGA